MDRIAVVSDLHANIPAVEAVWDEIGDVERIFCLGDIVGIGPRPSEVVSLVSRDRRFISVLGNHDVNTVEGTEYGPTGIVPRKPHHDWVREQLSDGDVEYLRGLNMSMSARTGGMGINMMHRHPEDCGSAVPSFKDPCPSALDEFYSGVDGDILLFGHTHMPLDVKGVGGRIYLNPGSVGVQNGGRARFLVLRPSGNGFDYEFREAPFDLEAVREDLADREVPYWDYILKVFLDPGGALNPPRK